MMMTKQPQLHTLPLDIIGWSSFGRYPKISPEQTWNMIISDDCLVPYPGYQWVQTLMSGGTGRQLFNSIRAQRLIAVVGSSLYTISAGFGVTFIGTLNTNTGNVFIAENENDEIGIVDGQYLYIYNYSPTAPTIFQVVNFGFSYTILPVSISFQDGYFIVCDGKTNAWYLSALNNGTNWLPGGVPSQGLLQTKPDKVVFAMPFNRTLLIMGKSCTEIWYDAGYALFPYQRSNYESIDYGCLSPNTIASGFGMVVWVGSNERSGTQILVTQGGPPQTISTDGINLLLSNLSSPTNSFGFLYRQDGHIFYQLTFVTDNISLVYDFTTQKFFNVSDQNQNHHIMRNAAYFNNAYYFLSFNDGNLYEISSGFYSYTTLDNVIDPNTMVIAPTLQAHEIPRVRICKNLRMPDGSRFIANNLTIFYEEGLDMQPERVQLSIARDGGYQYGSSQGKFLTLLGSRTAKFQFNNLGSANDMVVQIRMYSQNRFVCVGGTVGMYQ